MGGLFGPDPGDGLGDGIDRTMHHVSALGDDYGGSEKDRQERETPVPAEDANTISSRIADRPGWHAPVLDLDFPARLVPSSTPGHFHLYLDKPMPWEDYKRFLRVCAEVGILEEGYVSASIDRGASFVRKPGVTKEKEGWEILKEVNDRIEARAAGEASGRIKGVEPNMETVPKRAPKMTEPGHVLAGGIFMQAVFGPKNWTPEHTAKFQRSYACASNQHAQCGGVPEGCLCDCHMPKFEEEEA